MINLPSEAQYIALASRMSDQAIAQHLADFVIARNLGADFAHYLQGTPDATMGAMRKGGSISM